MRYLPLILTRGPLLAGLAEAAMADPNRRAVCTVCGGTMRVRPDRAAQATRCPHCWRMQDVAPQPAPARLRAEALTALARTRAWARHWPE